MDKIQGYSQIKSAIAAVKAYGEGMATNFFLSEERCDLLMNSDLMYVINYDKCVFILHKDYDFYHVYFTATNYRNLDISLKKLIRQYPEMLMVVDIVGTKSLTEQLSSLFEVVGFDKYILLYRMSRMKENKDIKELDARVEYAKSGQEDQIHAFFEEYFDKYSEQIPLMEELKVKIQNREILVVNDEHQRVIGFILFKINGLTAYLQYWFIHPNYRNQKIGSALFNKFFHESRFTKRQILWVIESNENAIVRQKHYGFEQEQLYDQIMMKKQEHETANS